MISFSVIAHFLAVASPGPDTLIIIRQSLKYGRRGGFLTALGIGCGILIHSYLAIFGISSLIFLFDFIKDIIIVFGSVYLIYLGLLSIFDNSKLQDKNTNSKYNSFLVEPSNLEKWSFALKNILYEKNKYKYLITNAYNDFKVNYQWDVRTNLIINFFKK